MSFLRAKTTTSTPHILDTFPNQFTSSTSADTRNRNRKSLIPQKEHNTPVQSPISSKPMKKRRANPPISPQKLHPQHPHRHARPLLRLRPPLQDRMPTNGLGRP